MLNNIKKFIQKNNLLIYKLAYDLLFILISFFILTLLAESLLPGIVSGRIGLYATIILICANLFLIFNIQKDDSAHNQNVVFSKKTLYGAFITILLFVFNSLLGLPALLNASILILTGVIIYLMYQVFLEED